MATMPMMGMGGDKMGAMEDEAASAPESSAAPEVTDDFAAAASEAFPDLAGDPARIEAFKTAVKLCLEKDLEGGYDEEPKPKADLLLAFGAPKPKK